MKEFFVAFSIVATIIAIVVAGIMGVIALAQPLRIYIADYTVEQQALQGEAELKRAEQNRQIRIQEAMAKKESAVFLAEAEVARAHGVAEANQIIAEGLGGPEGYLRYLWIQTLEQGSRDVIYIPTEANIPILEATRLTQ